MFLVNVFFLLLFFIFLVMSKRHLIVYGVAFFSLYFHCHYGTNFVCSYYIHFFLIDCHFIHRSCLKQTDTLTISLFLHTHSHSLSHTHPHTTIIVKVMMAPSCLAYSSVMILQNQLNNWTCHCSLWCQTLSLIVSSSKSFFSWNNLFFSSSNFYFLYLINQVILCYKRHQLTTSEPFRRWNN